MDSLKKLKTDYIDILYVHWWDWNTSIPEVMDGLHSLVMSGKVLYLVGVFSSIVISMYWSESYCLLAKHRVPQIVPHG